MRPGRCGVPSPCGGRSPHNSEPISFDPAHSRARLLPAGDEPGYDPPVMHRVLIIGVSVAALLLGPVGSFATAKGVSDAAIVAGFVLPKYCEPSYPTFIHTAPTRFNPLGTYGVVKSKAKCTNDMFGWHLTGIFATASDWFSRGQTAAGAIVTVISGLVALAIAGTAAVSLLKRRPSTKE
jgi:hypothetical protein